MLLTVYADQLLKTEHLQAKTTNPEYALAVQFLDYPLLVIRSVQPQPEVATNVIEFKRGKTCVLDADEQEVGFLIHNVPTTLMLLDVSCQSQPVLLAAGVVPLQCLGQAEHDEQQTAGVQKNVVLTDAAQQPVACVEMYAALQPGHCTGIVLEQQQQQQQIAVLSRQIPALLSQQAGSNKLRPHLSGMHDYQHPDLGHESYLVASSTWHGQGQAHLQHLYGNSPRPVLQQQQYNGSQQHSPLRCGVVLQHKRLPDDTVIEDLDSFSMHSNRRRKGDPASGANVYGSTISQSISAGINKGSRQPLAASVDNSSSQVVDATPTGNAGSAAAVSAAAHAKQILAGIRPASADSTRRRPAAGIRDSGLMHVVEAGSTDTLSKHGLLHGSQQAKAGQAASNKYSHTAMGRPVSWLPSSSMSSQQQHRWHQGLAQLKQQQVQHWPQHRQADVPQPLPPTSQLQRQGREGGLGPLDQEVSSVSVADISCELSKSVASNAGNTAAQGLAHLDTSNAVENGDGPKQAATANTALASPANQQQRQQPQQQAVHHMTDPGVPQQSQHVQSDTAAAAGPSSTANGAAGGCDKCTATLTAAVQLLQASQAGALSAKARANANSSSNSIHTGQDSVMYANKQQQQLQQEPWHNGVSATAAVTWELVTLMTMRAVMSQAVMGMTEQLSGAVKSFMQQALAGISSSIAVTQGLEHGRHSAAAAAAPVATTFASPAAEPAAAGFGLYTTPRNAVEDPNAPVAADAATAGPAVAAPFGAAGMIGDAQQAQQKAGTRANAAAISGSEQQLEHQLTAEQLQQQQEDLKKQFEQLDTLMVVRDNDSRSSGEYGSSRSSNSSREGRSRSVRHSSSGSDSSRHRNRDNRERRVPNSSALQRQGSALVWESGAAGAAGGSDVIGGMVLRLKKANSGRALAGSRQNSVIGALDGSKGSQQPSSEQQHTSGSNSSLKLSSNHVQSQASKDGSTDSSTGTDEIISRQMQASSAAAAAPAPSAKAATEPLVLPPLARTRSLDADRHDAYAAQSGRAGFQLSCKLSIASADTTYSDAYDEDFEPEETSQSETPSATAVGTAAASLLSRHAAVSLHSPGSAAAAAAPHGNPGANFNLYSPGGGSISWQRSSLKLERRGSELPNIPEIPEDSDIMSDEGAMSGIVAHSLPKGQRQQQPRGQLAAEESVAESLSMGNTLPAGCMPAAATAGAAGNCDSSRGGVGTSHSMAAHLPTNTKLTAIYRSTAAQPQVRPADMPAGSTNSGRNSTDRARLVQQGQQQQQQQQRDVARADSSVSLDSVLDDLLSSADLVLSPAGGSFGRAASIKQPGAAAAVAPKTADLSRQRSVNENSAATTAVTKATAARLSNYTDVSFLSDGEDSEGVLGSQAAGMGGGGQQQQQGSESYLSALSDSTDGSDVEVGGNYTAGASTPVSKAAYNASTARATGARTQGAAAGAEGTGIGTPRSPADVWNTNVSGTLSSRVGYSSVPAPVPAGPPTTQYLKVW